MGTHYRTYLGLGSESQRVSRGDFASANRSFINSIRVKIFNLIREGISVNFGQTKISHSGAISIQNLSGWRIDGNTLNEFLEVAHQRYKSVDGIQLQAVSYRKLKDFERGELTGFKRKKIDQKFAFLVEIGFIVPKKGQVEDDGIPPMPEIIEEEHPVHGRPPAGVKEPGQLVWPDFLGSI